MWNIDLRESGRKLVYVFFCLAELVLLFRVVLSLLDADYTNALIRWVYVMSEPLLLPFRNVFPDVEYLNNTHVLEFPVLFAMAAYAVVGYAVVSIVYWLPKPPVVKTKKK